MELPGSRVKSKTFAHAATVRKRNWQKMADWIVGKGFSELYQNRLSIALFLLD